MSIWRRRRNGWVVTPVMQATKPTDAGATYARITVVEVKRRRALVKLETARGTDHLWVHQGFDTITFTKTKAG